MLAFSCTVFHWPQTSCWHLLGWLATCLMWWMFSSSSGVLIASSMIPDGLGWWSSVCFLLRQIPVRRSLVLGDCLWGSINIASSLFNSNSSRRETTERRIAGLWPQRFHWDSVNKIWFGCRFHLHLMAKWSLQAEWSLCNLLISHERVSIYTEISRGNDSSYITWTHYGRLDVAFMTSPELNYSPAHWPGQNL